VATLVTPEGARFSELERLRRPPTRTTGTAFARSLERVDEIGAFQLGRVRLSQVPPNRLAALARYGLGSKAASLERAEEPKRTAMLTAVMRHLEAKAIDEALDLSLRAASDCGLRQVMCTLSYQVWVPGLPVTASHSAFAVSFSSSTPSVRPGPTSP